ncbi:MAG: hypothetical protein K6C36_05715 [Clostridia bacterium]|nr:hypothetical protein [Clostridia bacterium]
METTIFLVIMLPLSAFFTGLGIFAWKRKKPMWFWANSEVSEKEISDVPAYNRANGIMWLAYSAVFWISSVLGLFNVGTAGAVLAAGCLGGIPVLIVVYQRIYKKYRVRKHFTGPRRDTPDEMK